MRRAKDRRSLGGLYEIGFMPPRAFALSNFARRQMSGILQEKNQATRRSLEREETKEWLQLLRITI